ncbi:MAG: ShlB/FhaC/HecB family hemolysin secretion/activation protein [Polaromonas sp.]|uniref:ShlB/FhaC/HecB family hemolysin secretion/activation protein n=1 Tax=Polaromonas sp. TaxID=1869339 RepID=UPI002736ED81|nr:ShlB/FhaC/HecB family hemolysin secretion/activation protein [Polaromonas sp.]MDP2816983.1 ShlB/FhaC/HecB family hemolysin secretion/activation protein [Polaromonas sp.]
MPQAITLALCSLAAHAQVTPAPNAGQVLRELQTPSPALPSAVPAPRTEPTVDTAASNATKVLVKSITITGNQEIATSELTPLVSSLVGSEQTLSQLNAAARRITAYYRARGFAVARALLPAQDITSGAVTILVIEGRVSSSRVSNTSRLPDALVNSYIAEVKPGDVIRSSQIDRGILLLQDTPGIASSRATLQPGASVGTSELLIEVTPAPLLTGSATLDNYGSRYTGEYRVGGNFALAGPLGRGDQLSFSALTSGSGLSFGRIAYQIPVGSDGLRLGAAYFDTRYKLGREFALLEAQGSANSTSVFAAYPFIRSPAKNLSGTLSFESKNLNDKVNATATTTDKKIGLTGLGLSGNLQDAFMGGGINSFDLGAVMGNLNIASAGALAIDAASAQTNGSYSKVTYGLSRLQRINNSTLVSVSLNGQQASKNLDSSEKFSLGGPTGVRAYPGGEASGDEGFKGTLEVRHSFTQVWQGTVFYDVGEVTINKRPFGVPASPAKRALAGAGVGINASLAALQLKASLAWRTHGGQAASIPASAAKTPTLWLQAVVTF